MKRKQNRIHHKDTKEIHKSRKALETQPKKYRIMATPNFNSTTSSPSSRKSMEKKITNDKLFEDTFLQFLFGARMAAKERTKGLKKIRDGIEEEELSV